MYWLSYKLSSVFGVAMSSAIFAMMTACALPFFWAAVAKKMGGFGIKDNQRPREFLANLSGMAARANAVQVNSFETLPMFLAATVLAIYCFVPQPTINGIAWLYVLLRMGYGACYLVNLATLRSLMWALSMACVFMLFALSARMIG